MWYQRATVRSIYGYQSMTYDKIMFLSYQKVPKVENVCSNSKEGGLF